MKIGQKVKRRDGAIGRVRFIVESGPIVDFDGCIYSYTKDGFFVGFEDDRDNSRHIIDFNPSEPVLENVAPTIDWHESLKKHDARIWCERNCLIDLDSPRGKHHKEGCAFLKPSDGTFDWTDPKLKLHHPDGRVEPNPYARQDRTTLTRREQFAMAAMQGLLARLESVSGSSIVGPHIPKLAIDHADALIAALDEEKK